jgi:hypothetical protein
MTRGGTYRLVIGASYDDDVAPTDIDNDDVLAAIAEYDRLGQDEFLKRYEFGKASKRRVVHNGKFYDSKALAGVAHGFATNDFWTAARPFGGTGPGGAVTILESLGFFIDPAGWLFKLKQLNVDRTHGKPAPYQYVILLWAIGRARIHVARVLNFSEARPELRELLAPFAIATTAPDPAMPWAALGNSDWWQLGESGKPIAATESEVKSQDIPGGLSEEVYWRVAEDETFARAAVDVLKELIGPDPAVGPLLQMLGLAADEPATETQSASPDVSDAVAAVDQISEPRRKFSRRLSAAENKAIEEQAVRVARQHFESELGYQTVDVGATESYDVHATKGDEVVKVEVKGTTTNGASIVLTRNEVQLHRAAHPNNALAVVRNIVLDRSSDEPVGTGGELVLVRPWKIDESGLSAIAYEYRTGI